MEIKKILYHNSMQDFLDEIDPEASEKIVYNIQKVLNQSNPDKNLFKKLEDGIWEFRTLYKKTKYRLLAFWCPKTKSLIVATNGFIKKDSRIKEKYLNKAKEIRIQYLNSLK